MKIALKPLDQQTIVVTGASSGIGLVTARMAAEAGAKLVLAARNEEALQQLAEEIRAQGGQAIAVRADVGIEEDVRHIAEAAIAEFGSFDTWVNNAGLSIFGRCDQVTIEDQRRMFDTVYWGVVYGSRTAVEHFKQRGTPGALINIGSFFGDRATPVQSTYCAAKHAVHGWTDALRMELEMEKAPVSVTLVHPGRIDTPYNEHAQSYYEHQVAHRGMVYPPHTVAEAILFAAAHPKRDMYVGGQAKVLKMLGDVAPRFMDKLMEVITDPGQVDPARLSVNPQTSALYKAGYGLKENGSHQGWFRSGSIYVKMQKHPVLAAAVVAGLGLALNAASKARKSQKTTAGNAAAPTNEAAAPAASAASDGQTDAGADEVIILTEIEVY
ncbi:MAG TPA: SDR family oxidoreductase [Hymenobacter sp.]|jgi:short-subunit dehydrogenase|uniref:SDR family oxidoreductase n=1 Tax=Hymenobacter sp. TaxID=1898978 RepID=UPI002ED7EBCB